MKISPNSKFLLVSTSFVYGSKFKLYDLMKCNALPMMGEGKVIPDFGSIFDGVIPFGVIFETIRGFALFVESNFFFTFFANGRNDERWRCHNCFFFFV